MGANNPCSEELITRNVSTALESKSNIQQDGVRNSVRLDVRTWACGWNILTGICSSSKSLWTAMSGRDGQGWIWQNMASAGQYFGIYDNDQPKIVGKCFVATCEILKLSEAYKSVGVIPLSNECRLWFCSKTLSEWEYWLWNVNLFMKQDSAFRWEAVFGNLPYTRRVSTCLFERVREC